MNPKKQDEMNSRRYPVQEYMHLQQVEWRIQRIGYFFLFAIVILGACGLFSKGMLSNKQAVSADGTLQVEYERFGRLASDMSMTIHLKPQQAGHFKLTLSGEEMDNFQIQSLQPQPQQAFSSGNTLELHWAFPRYRDGATVWIGLQSQKPGRYPVTVTLDDKTSVEFTQWIYP